MVATMAALLQLKAVEKLARMCQEKLARMCQEKLARMCQEKLARMRQEKLALMRQETPPLMRQVKPPLMCQNPRPTAQQKRSQLKRRRAPTAMWKAAAQVHGNANQAMSLGARSGESKERHHVMTTSQKCHRVSHQGKAGGKRQQVPVGSAAAAARARAPAAA
jgi:hypothetical protein